MKGIFKISSVLLGLILNKSSAARPNPPSFLISVLYPCVKLVINILLLRHLSICIIAFVSMKNIVGSITWTVQLRKYWMIYRGSGFFAVVWFGSSPTPSPHLLSLNLTGGTQKDWERNTTCWRENGGGGRGRARSRIIQQQDSLALCKSFNTLWYNDAQEQYCWCRKSNILSFKRCFLSLITVSGSRIDVDR